MVHKEGPKDWVVALGPHERRQITLKEQAGKLEARRLLLDQVRAFAFHLKLQNRRPKSTSRTLYFRT